LPHYFDLKLLWEKKKKKECWDLNGNMAATKAPWCVEHSENDEDFTFECAWPVPSDIVW